MKTNALRILDHYKVIYEMHEYTAALSGVEVAQVLHQNPSQVFKTLVTVGKSNKNYVFVIPSNRQLDLRKAAKLVTEKSIEMIPQKELFGLTGYVHGGCSPFGMKKNFPTYVDHTVLQWSTVMVSGGKIGLQVSLDLKQYFSVFHFEIAELCSEDNNK